MADEQVSPALLFPAGGGVLRSGRHGWFRYDREFWVPYLLRDPESADGLHRGRGIAEAS
jgi:hypothetical protein